MTILKNSQLDNTNKVLSKEPLIIMLFMKGNLLTNKEMAKEFFIMKMEIFIVEIGVRIKFMVKESTFIKI